MPSGAPAAPRERRLPASEPATPLAAHRLVPVVAGLLGVFFVAAAVGRVRAGETLSPPDLAFFFQSCWSAAHGAGFHQTALEFDRGTLLGSIHLSPVRALQVPVCRVVPHPAGLVATQAAGIALAAAVCAKLIGSGRRLAALALLFVGLHPLTLALATVDMRPLTFLVPAGALVALGVYRERVGPVVVGAVLAAAAREEAPLVLAAFLPAAWGRRRPVQLALLAGIGLSAALPWLAWGHGANIRTNTDPLATLDQIRTGARPVFRWHQETHFLGRALLAGVPALLAPELLVPALGGWLWILVFSELEPAAPGQGGLHYLAVVAALLLPAVAVGLGRLHRWRASPALLAGLGLLTVVGASPELGRLLRWSAATQPDDNTLFIDVLNTTQCPVLVPQHLAPAVAARPVLRIQGHLAATPERVEEIAAEVVHAVILTESPTEPTAAAEWARWTGALEDHGLLPLQSAGSWTLWGLSSPGPGCPPTPPGARDPGS